MTSTIVTIMETNMFGSSNSPCRRAAVGLDSASSTVDREQFNRSITSTADLMIPTIDHRQIQNVTTVASEPVPSPVKKLYVEDFIIVWLDANIGLNKDTRKTIEQLRCVANDIETFRYRKPCIEFISQIKEEQVFLIVSGSLGQDTVPCVADFRQIEAIYIFCANQDKHMQWSTNYQKVHGVFTDIDLLCEHIRQRIRQFIHNCIGFHIVGNSSTKQQEAEFMYAQLFQDILLNIRPNQNDLEDMIKYCRFQYTNNSDELKWISRFERDYVCRSPARWYTCQMFLYKMMNKALRMQEIDTMYALRFFISHLHNQLVQLSKQLFIGDTINLYRVQCMLTDEFEKLISNPGGLLSFSNFLSTSADIEKAKGFIPKNLNKNNVAVLMTIVVDPSMTQNVPFASIEKFSMYPIEKEWLFSMGSVFRIGEIQRGIDGVWLVHLTPTDDRDPHLNSLKTYLRNEIKDADSLVKLGIILLEMGQHEKAERFYQKALPTVNHWEDLARIHNGLGLIYWNSKQLDNALKEFQRSLVIKRNWVSNNHPILAPTYNNIGMIYGAMNQFELAVDHYQLALDIEYKRPNPNHEGIASICNNLANILCTKGKYSDGLSYHQQVLQIRRNVLSSTHPSIALSFSNIAKCFYLMGQFSEAANYARKAVNIDLQSLPFNHPQIKLHQNDHDIYHRAMKL